jgi:GTPase SAR1 family protein
LQADAGAGIANIEQCVLGFIITHCFGIQYMRTADAFIILYSVTSRDSFELAIEIYHNLMETAQRENTPEKPVVFLGNKIDLTAERQVIIITTTTLCLLFHCN